MTKRSRTFLKGRFETGDIPSQTDYGDLMDSFLNLEASGAETMAGTLKVPEVNLGIFRVSGKIVRSFVSAAGAGTTQGSATRIGGDINIIAVDDAAERAVRLSAHDNGRVQYVIVASDAVTAATVFPASGDHFVGTASDAGILVASEQTLQLIHFGTSAIAFVRY